MAAMLVLQQPDGQSTGTNVLESRYEATIAKPTASDSGTNSDRAAPCMKNDETNTARMQSMASSRGHGGLCDAIQHGPRQRLAALQLRVDVLDLDGRFVDQDADGQGQPAERHQVDRLSGNPQREHRAPSAPSGMLSTTTSALRQSRRNSRTITPTRTAPNNPSVTTPATARVT